MGDDERASGEGRDRAEGAAGDPPETGAAGTGGESGGGAEGETAGRRARTGRDPGAGRAGPGGTRPGAGGPGEEGARAERGWGDTLHGVQEAVGDMMGEVLDGVRDVAAGRRFPRVDVLRTEGEGYRLLVDLPGVQKDELAVTTMGGEITIAGRRRPRDVPEGAELLRSERGHGSFRRSIRLPADAREDEVRATLEDGVLLIRVPLAEPGDARRVEID